MLGDIGGSAATDDNSSKAKQRVYCRCVQPSTPGLFDDSGEMTACSERREMEQMIKSRMASLDLPMSEYGT